MQFGCIQYEYNDRKGNKKTYERIILKMKSKSIRIEYKSIVYT